MIDWTRIQELRDEIGEDDLAEVMEMFLAEVDEVIARLRAAPDPARYEDDLHFLKSSALNLGFSALSALCQAGESRSAAGQANAVDLAPIFETYVASKAELLAAQRINWPISSSSVTSV